MQSMLIWYRSQCIAGVVKCRVHFNENKTIKTFVELRHYTIYERMNTTVWTLLSVMYSKQWIHYRNSLELTAFSIPLGHTEGVRLNHTVPIKPISLSAKVYRMLWGNAITCTVTLTQRWLRHPGCRCQASWRCFFHSCSRRYAALSSSPRATLAPFCITNERWKHFFTLSCGAFDSLWQAVHIFVVSFFLCALHF